MRAEVHNENEVYVYRNGILIYKKWIKQNNSVVLNTPPNWKPKI